jgi:C4-dicarboxylate transporter/malic acid transport protein
MEGAHTTLDVEAGGVKTNLTEKSSKQSSTRDGGGRLETEERSVQVDRISAISHTISISERLLHFTWAWYLTTMATGSIGVLLANQPHQFPGLHVIGKIFLIFEICLFILITTGLIQRFWRRPELLARSLRNPYECLFTPALLLSLSNMILMIEAYGVPAAGLWLRSAILVIFWIYSACSLLVAVILYLDLFTARRMTDKDIIPAWLLPVFPLMLAGTIAGTIAETQPIERRMSILVAGTTFQGVGFWVALSIFGPLMSRLMRIGLPAPALRPGMFISVGPPAYTSHALLKLSNSFMNSAQLPYIQRFPESMAIIHHSSLALSIFIWCLAFWWFCISLGTMLLDIRDIGFSLVWYSMIFPNVGLSLATIDIGLALSSDPILWIGSGMTIILVSLYIFIFSRHILALWKGDILWPGKDEDKDS